MADALPRGSTIGIIGGGQLGRMLAGAAAALGYHTVVLEPQADCPAAQLCNRQIIAAYDDEAALDELCAVCSVITYEFENVPLAAARRVTERCPLFPPAKALDVAQDRVVEKTFLNDAGVPTAQFQAADMLDELTQALAAFGNRAVVKTRRFGYDGKGQHVFKGEAHDLPAIFERLDASGQGAGLIVELLVPFEAEFSIIAARSRDGAITAYPAARNVHEDGILRESTVPSGIAQPLLDSAAAHCEAILTALDYVGVIGVEFFATADGVVANEIAPRVHNTGHWTVEACLCGQFEQHIRAIVGLPLGSPALLSPHWTMRNLLGAEIEDMAALLATAGATVTDYGKADAKPGRKMGHVAVQMGS